MSKALFKNYRQSPRKVRLVTNSVKGQTVPQALLTLSFLPKRAALSVKKSVESAAANAKTTLGVEREGLYIKDIRVDGGAVLKRSMPRARGSAFMIHKRTSHIKVVLDRIESKPPRKLSRAKARKIKAGVITVK